MPRRGLMLWSTGPFRLFAVLPMILLVTLASALRAEATLVAANAETYTNPLSVRIGNEGLVESCADPSLIRGQTAGDNYWYMYCTTDPLNDEDRQSGGGFNFRQLPMLRSLDLVDWEYMGDAFSGPPARPRPAWADPTAGIWAPEIDFFDGKYYLYYGITDVTSAVSGAPQECHGDNAIGVATSTSPLGPWTDSGQPVVAPRPNGSPDGCNFFWTYDPEVIVAEGQKYIYFGSYYGGVHVRRLAADGLTSDAGTQMQVAIANRYEGPEVVSQGGYYYMFLSATDCCRGPLTGYSVFAGRSLDPMGPFVDREGVGLTSSRVGGTPVISMNGNRWVGPGHNSVFTDAQGQWWTVYHAIDQSDYFFGDDKGFTKRPVLLDPLEWVGGWPMVRGGLWASDSPQPAPAAQAGDPARVAGGSPRQDRIYPGNVKAAFSDEFNGTTLAADWTWVRPPAANETEVMTGTFRFDTQDKDLYQGSNNASVLTRPAPAGEYVVETRVKLTVPPDGCCFNYRQGGLLIYANDDKYIKLSSASIWETRQTEFAKEQEEPIKPNEPNRYGNTVVGAPGEWTWLRISKRIQGDQELYTPYTSRDGVSWVRGGVWAHQLGTEARIGLVSMGGPDFESLFDYVRVYELHGTVLLPIVQR